MRLKRKYGFFKGIAVFLSVNILVQTLLPVASYALTSGPSQPEVQSFEPVGTTEMVDLFTGDFTYNIPLFDLPGPNGGYPFNMAYNSGVSMDQEASWVGLGWNLNPGAITRQMRGLPDEFNGGRRGAFEPDVITKTMDHRPSVTFGVGVAANVETFGGDVAQGSIGLGVNVFYNNYKGVGYSIEPSLSFNAKMKEGLAAGVGLNLSLNSQEGLGVNASISLSEKVKEPQKSFNVGVGYHSRAGLTGVSVGYTESYYRNVEVTNKKGETSTNRVEDAIGGSSHLSFLSGGYSPNPGLAMEGINMKLSYKAGAELFGLFPNGTVNGFFASQFMQNRNVAVTTPAFGYLNLQNAGGDDLLDFNREKDGMIRKNSPNLAIPSMTSDIYSVTGQGISGMYRAYRNDIGILHDPEVTSTSAGGNFGLEGGIGAGVHTGADASVSFSQSVTSRWNTFNATGFNFKNPATLGPEYEPYYFKTYGEHTSDDINELGYIGGTKPVRIRLESDDDPIDKQFTATHFLENKYGNSYFPTNGVNETESREPRNLAVQYIDNDPQKGMYALNPDGSTYFYKNRVMNTEHIECQFACGEQLTNLCGPTILIEEDPDHEGRAKHTFNNTDHYYSHTSMSPYPHAYLLTSIQGADYVDADNIPGPSDGDFGYWVKFHYSDDDDLEETTGLTPIDNSYKWRVPFTGANYIRGLNTTFEDDKGSYIYGEKKVSYLRQVETKTHKAVFYISRRKDARGAASELQNSGDTKLDAYSYKLDQIVLSSKSDPSKPIKKVNFKYSYKLCPGVENNDHSDDTGIDGDITNDGGKLTLERVWFTYENSQRGSLSPYVFNYNESNTNENPGYNTHKYDRWGNYKPYDASINDQVCGSINFPYVKQFDLSNSEFRSETDRNMAVWNLKTITLPSGGTINVQYEADDYAYVQDKRAMQMFQIASLQQGNTRSGTISHDRWAGGDRRRVYFKLEKPILDGPDAQNELAQYFEGISKLYFRVFMNVRESTDNRQDFISGYADIEDFRLDPASKSGDVFTRAYVQMGRPKVGDRELAYHNFSVGAWQYIRTDQPVLAGVGPFDTDPNSNKSAAMNKVKSLVSIVPTIIQTFKGFNKYAYDEEWGRTIIPDKSFIRLNAPDKVKIGGGVRVKQITLSDNWTADAGTPSVYGQVYDYSMKEKEDGQPISSGVAAYEPMIGGDEIPHRTVKEYPEKIPLKTNNNLFFELPVNESYFPGPQVGYRKVTVKSLATHYERVPDSEVPDQDPYDIPAGIMTTGATVHEFYTAKDFPVKVDETLPDIQPFDLFIPIPLIGEISVNNITASQGYSVVLNDMHGKPKKVSNYRQDAGHNILFDAPVSYVEYFYNSNVVKNNSNPDLDYLILNSQLPVLISDRNGVVTKDTRLIGQDFEFFTDMRSVHVDAGSGGVSLNMDVVIAGVFPLPVIVPWPSMSTSTTEVKTAVTNKIIHQSGILMSTKAYDGGSTVITNNVLFDNLTGQPVLTTVTNDFDDPIFNYTIPAHMVYEGMGPAYKNIGLTFDATLGDYIPATKTYPITVPSPQNDLLVPGDELLFKNGAAEVRGIIFFGKDGIKYLNSQTQVPAKTYTFSITRSGRRNHLSASAGSITTLGDKTDKTIGDPTIR
jgi:hypothetical protein